MAHNLEIYVISLPPSLSLRRRTVARQLSRGPSVKSTRRNGRGKLTADDNPGIWNRDRRPIDARVSAMRYVGPGEGIL